MQSIRLSFVCVSMFTVRNNNHSLDLSPEAVIVIISYGPLLRSVTVTPLPRDVHVPPLS